MTHRHSWLYPGGVIQGRNRDESVVVRYCHECGERQMAAFTDWQKATGNYSRDEHYA